MYIIQNLQWTQQSILRIIKRKDYDLNRLFLENISRDGQIAWESGPYGSIQTVRKEYAQNHIAVTKRVVEVKGGLFKQMPLKKDMANIH